MDKLEVFGAKKLRGSVYISGSKNAALEIETTMPMCDQFGSDFGQSLFAIAVF